MAPPREDLAQAIADALARVKARPTARVSDAALLLDRSPHRVYEDLRRDGAVAGIPAVRLGERTVRVQSRALLRVLGLEP